MQNTTIRAVCHLARSRGESCTRDEDERADRQSFCSVDGVILYANTDVAE